ncbi:ligand-binding sensor domain-containing protein [Spongiimicrobium salis]|uniref:ligand-binding sensor domain-containing protein n=1 Tax=Spongiimicrobium salis TaxID=1667022 RepID=UPI00374D6440
MQRQDMPKNRLGGLWHTLFFLFLGIPILSAQKIPAFNLINTQSGLSSNIVYDVLKDQQGYIWIATDNGLNRFDGYTFEVFYHHAEDSTSISSNIIRSLEQDQEGNLWIGTFNGINLYRPETKTFTRYSGHSKLPTDRLDMQFMRWGGDGKLWFLYKGTIGKFNVQSRRYEFTGPSLYLYDMEIGPENTAWIMTKDGKLLEHQPQTQQWSTVSKSPRPGDYAVAYGPYSKKLWVDASFPVPQGNTQMKALPQLPDNTLPKTVLETENGELWLGNEQGLYIYEPEQNRLTPVNFGQEASTLSQSIKSIYQEDTGAVWVGTLSGVFHFDPYQKEFNNLKISPNAGDVIMGMGTYNDQVLLNRLGEGLYGYSKTSGTFHKLDWEIGASEGVHFIWDIEEVPDSQYPVWIASDAGLVLYDPLTKRSKQISFPSTGPNTIKVSFSILSAGDDHIWVATARDIHLLDKKEGQILKSVSFAAEVVNAIIQDIALIGDYLFVATEGQGIFVYHTLTEKMGLLSEYTPEAIKIQNTPIWELFVQENTLWLGSSNGLFHLDTSQWEFQKITLSPKVSNQIIFSIAADDQDRLWIGTGAGLAMYDHKTKEINQYTANDGIENIEFNRKSVLQVGHDLWFGGVQGITVFDPSRIQQNPKVPPVYLTSVRVIMPDSVFSPPINKKQQIKLPWYQNILEFSYVTLNYTNPAQNQYKYQLKNYDPDWREDTGNRQARYVQVPPGSYDFYLQAANNDGLWNPEMVHLSIEITPPFWETYWFRGLVFLLIVLFLWLAYRYRVKKLLEVERIKLRIAGDLHDEIGSGLSSIALTGDMVQRQLNKGNAKPELVSRITKNARTLASLLDAIVWLIDPHKQSLEDLVSKSKAVAQELLPGVTLHFKEDLGAQYPKRDFSPEQKRNLFLFIKESIHNAAKHAQATEVSIDFIGDHKQFVYQIKDNGKGFDPAVKKQGHGVSSMKKRAEDLKAVLRMDSGIDQGTLIRLSVKLP